jgi:aminotransferase
MVLELADKTEGLLYLHQGVPCCPTPEHILAGAVKAIRDHRADQYSPTAGISPLLECICDKLKAKNKIIAHPEQVIVTAGASQGIMLALMTLADPGDEVMLLSPSYASHIEQVYLAGMHPLFVPMETNGQEWELQTARLEEVVQSRIRNGAPLPRCVVLCSPHNPTGYVMPKKTLFAIGKWADSHSIAMITDEAYEDFVFDGHEHFSLASNGDLSESCISCFSFSKSYAMTGWRVGYVVVPKALAALARSTHDNLAICAPVASQYAALAALTGPQDCISSYRRELNLGRQFAIDAIRRLRFLDPRMGHGAFYLFPQITVPVSSTELGLRLAREAGVLVVPGEGFGPEGGKHLRISFVSSIANLAQAFERLETWASSAELP